MLRVVVMLLSLVAIGIRVRSLAFLINGARSVVVRVRTVATFGIIMILRLGIVVWMRVVRQSNAEHMSGLFMAVNVIA